ncbi:MAG: hypothetical protein WD059_15125 [Balneolaceae bacterium]
MKDINKLIDRAQDEVLWILIAYYVFKSRPNLFNSKEINRHQFVGLLIMTKCLVRDIVLRLTRLDEKGQGAKLFREITKHGGKSSKYADNIVDWKNAVINFRDRISHLKNERNEFIAHLKDTNPSAYRIEEIPSELQECIIEAIKVVDTFRGKKVSYTFSVGSMEPDINLREYIGTE